MIFGVVTCDDPREHHDGREAEDGNSAASHGCIRMHIADVEALYSEFPVGASVYIA